MKISNITEFVLLEIILNSFNLQLIFLNKELKNINYIN